MSFLKRLARKYVDDGGSDLAALLTYYAFLAVFPMLLAGVTVLGIVLRNYPDLQDRVLASSVTQFPVLGTELRANVRGLPGVSGLVTGLVVGLLGARAFCLVLQRTVDVVWAVPKDERPTWLSRQLRTLWLVGIVGLGVVGSAALTAVASTSGLRLLLLVLVLPLTAGLLLAVFRTTAPDAVPTRDLALSAAIAAVGLVGLQLIGTRVVVHLTTSKEVYGAFAAVLGLLAWLYLQAQVLVVALEVGGLPGGPTRVTSDVVRTQAGSRALRPTDREETDMPIRAWTKKRERQYEHIKDSALERGESKEQAKEIAARTVNKERARAGEAKESSRLSREDISSGRRGGLRSHKGAGGPTYKQLYNEAKDRSIKGRSDMTKEQLAKALQR